MTWSYDEATDTFTFQTEDDEQPSTERGRFNEELGLTLYSTDGWTWSEEQ